MNESKKPYASVGGTELSLWDITKILLAKIHWLLLAGVVVAAGVYAVAETNHPLLPPDGCLYSAEHHQQRLR